MGDELRIEKLMPGDFEVVKLAKKDAKKLKEGLTLTSLRVKAVDLSDDETLINKYHGQDRLALMRGGVLYLSESRCKQLALRSIKVIPTFNQSGPLQVKQLDPEDASLAKFNDYAKAQLARMKKTTKTQAKQKTTRGKIQSFYPKNTLKRIHSIFNGTQTKFIQGMSARTILKISRAQQQHIKERRRYEDAKKKDALFLEKQTRWKRQDEMKSEIKEREIAKRRLHKEDLKEERIDRREDRAEIRFERKADRIEDGKENQTEKIKKQTS